MEENESRDLVDGLTNAFRVTFLVSVLSGSINCYIIAVFCVSTYNKAENVIYVVQL